jgi:hypothetical protein
MRVRSARSSAAWCWRTSTSTAVGASMGSIQPTTSSSARAPSARAKQPATPSLMSARLRGSIRLPASSSWPCRSKLEPVAQQRDKLLGNHDGHGLLRSGSAKKPPGATMTGPAAMGATVRAWHPKRHLRLSTGRAGGVNARPATHDVLAPEQSRTRARSQGRPWRKSVRAATEARQAGVSTEAPNRHRPASASKTLP